METHVKFVNVIFENCEWIRVPGEALYHLGMNTQDTGYDSYHNTQYANKVSITIDLSKIKPEDAARLHKGKDITHLHFYYKTGYDQEITVPYPMYFSYWYRNPYQDNSKWTDNGRELLDIDIEQYWSLLSIKQVIFDYIRMVVHNFPTGLRILLSGYWATFKRHFKVKH